MISYKPFLGILFILWREDVISLPVSCEVKQFEQHELPVWTESQELRRFIAGYLSLLPLKKAAMEIDKRFVEYLLELPDGVTGRIIEVLRRAAFQAIADKSEKVGLPQLQYVGARMPSVIGRRS